VLVPENRPVPTPKPGEVLIRIVAAGVNQADCHQRAGLWVAVASALSLPAAIWPTTVEAGENVCEGAAGNDRMTATGLAGWHLASELFAERAGIRFESSQPHHTVLFEADISSLCANSPRTGGFRARILYP
jgi:hypothetical protein